MSTNEAKKRTQTLPYLNALLTHPTPCHNPKNTQENSLLAPTPKNRLHKHEHKHAQHNPPLNNNLQQKNSKPCAGSTKTVSLALRQQNSKPCATSTKQTNKRTNKLTKRTKV